MIESVDLDKLISVIDLMPNPVVINRYQAKQAGELSSDDFLYVNTAFIQLIGYEITDIPNDKAWFEKSCPDISYRNYITQAWYSAMESSRKQNKSFTSLPAKIRCKDGFDRWFQVTAHPEKRVIGDLHLIVFVEIDTPEELIISLQDKSERLHQQNQDLQKSKAVLAETQRIARIGSWEVNFQEDTVTWSAEMYRIFGEKPDSFTPF